MPKHRQSGFAVVREINRCPFEGHEAEWYFHGIVGVYQSTHRADEVSAATLQHYLDIGMDPELPEFRFKVVPTNWYDE